MCYYEYMRYKKGDTIECIILNGDQVLEIRNFDIKD